MLVSDIFWHEFLCFLVKVSTLISLVRSPTLLLKVAIDKRVRPIQKDYDNRLLMQLGYKG